MHLIGQDKASQGSVELGIYSSLEKVYLSRSYSIFHPPFETTSSFLPASALLMLLDQDLVGQFPSIDRRRARSETATQVVVRGQRISC